MIGNKVVAYYPRLLDLTYRVVNSLKGKQHNDSRILTCEQFAMKIFLHAVTINHLRVGSNVTLADFKDGSHVVDFASVMVIARAVLETYIQMFQTIFEPQNDDEFEYRHAVYELRGFKAAEMIVRLDPNSQDLSSADIQQLERRIKEVEQMRERIKKTQVYQSLGAGQQRATLEGKLYPDRRFPEMAKAAGFGSNFIEYAYSYLSAYTHGDALSVSQVKVAVTDEQKDSYMRLAMALVMMVLSHLILNYARKFKEAQVVCDMYPEDTRLAVILAKQSAGRK